MRKFSISCGLGRNTTRGSCGVARLTTLEIQDEWAGQIFRSTTLEGVAHKVSFFVWLWYKVCVGIQSGRCASCSIYRQMHVHLNTKKMIDGRHPACRLQIALQEATPGTGQVASALLSAAFPLRLPGLTAIMGRFTKQGRWAVSLEIFHVLPSLGLELDTTVCNAALAACMRGCVWHRAKQVFSLMLAQGVSVDHITYHTMLSVPRRRKIWRVVIEVCAQLSLTNNENA
jgi:pentatricopeptide repeat protein